MPGSPTPLTSSHGITLTFGDTVGVIRKVKDFDLSSSCGVDDISDLSLPEGSLRDYIPQDLLGGDEIKIDADYPASGTLPKINDEGPIETNLGALTGWAVCTNAVVKYATGELVALSLTFKVGDDPES
jgi:hypothetical protein